LSLFIRGRQTDEHNSRIAAHPDVRDHALGRAGFISFGRVNP